MNKLEQYRTHVEEVKRAFWDKSVSPEAYADLLESVDWMVIVENLLPVAEAAHDLIFAHEKTECYDALQVALEELEEE